MRGTTSVADEGLLAPDPIVIRDSIQRQLRVQGCEHYAGGPESSWFLGPIS